MEEDYEEEFYYPTIHEVKDWNKSSLYTFTINIDNKFDNSIERLIKLLESEKSDLNKEIKKLPPNRFHSKDFDHQNDIYILNDDDFNRSELSSKVYVLEEELKALIEMKIIYAFKSLEINLKKLLTDSFNLKNKRELFQWEKVVDFLNNKNINLKTVKGYEEINQLRLVNNSIKHSEKLEEKTLKLMFNKKEFDNISEFSPIGKIINYSHLLSFYNRIEPFVIPFLEDLCDVIYKEQYVFDNEKLDSIAEGLVLRMEKEDAFKLIEKIKELY